MKKTFPLPVVIAGVFLGLVIAFKVPDVVLAYKIHQLESECGQPRPSQTCVVRMRLMGHRLSDDGDMVRAETWYKKAADARDAEAMFHLGWLYFHRGIQKWQRDQPYKEDKALAKNWYLKSAKLGFAPAMNNLSFITMVSENSMEFEQSRAWLLKAANQHNPIAMWNIVLRGEPFIVPNAKPWSVWNPRTSNPVFIAHPTLERTIYGPFDPPGYMIDEIRNAAKTGKQLALYDTNAKLEANMPKGAMLGLTGTIPVNPNLKSFKEYSREKAAAMHH